MKKAFTLIELIAVIVIVGILSLIGVNIYTNMYTNYVSSKIINELETETEVILEQISVRLSDRVRAATIGRVGATADFVVVDDDGLTENHNVLEWIGQSVDSQIFGANNFANTVGWSGSVDLFDSNNINGLVSLGSDFAQVSRFITLAGGNIDSVAIVFEGTLFGGARQFGFGFGGAGDNTNRIAIVNLAGINRNTIPNANIINSANLNTISDLYQLAHTAYAIVPVTEPDIFDPAINVTNLYLYYNYQPWNNNQTYTTDGTRVLLARDISMFRFRGVDGAIDLKLCLRDRSGLLDNSFVVCKTKAVF